MFFISSLSTKGINEVADADMPHIRLDDPVYLGARTKYEIFLRLGGIVL